MGFKKLALAVAVAAAPMSALALEPMQDEALSSVTGQDGITIGLSLNATLDLAIEDTDGLDGTANTEGMIIIDNMGIDTGTTGIDLVIDSSSTASGGGVLQVAVSIDSLTIDTGDIYVGQGTDGSDVEAGIDKIGTELTAIGASATPNPILESVEIGLSNIDLTLQLGSEADNLFALSTTSEFDITIGTLQNAGDSFTLNDLSSTGAIIVDQVAILGVDVNGITGQVNTAGLSISTNGALADIDVAAMGVKLGSAASSSIGNVYVTGLDLSNQTITIAGHTSN